VDRGREEGGGEGREEDDSNAQLKQGRRLAKADPAAVTAQYLQRKA